MPGRAPPLLESTRVYHPGLRASRASLRDRTSKFAAFVLEMKLLRRECLAFADDGYTILALEIGAFDRTIVNDEL